MTVRLYALDGCPYCEEVMATLEEHDVEYETEWVEARFSERPEVKRVSNQRGVPVLEDTSNSVVMANTERIKDYVRRSLA